ncbi:MAG: ASPIC/UnbV domain-containing protein, partial [Ilumatobacter sp.]|nr:ASPIC/UnbV domain-containing protein [Ilumatobacter sp.]
WFDADLLDAHRQAGGDWPQSRDLWLASPPVKAPNLALQNTGDLKFEDRSAAWGVAADPQVSTAAAFGDLDGDGDLDIVVNNFDAPAAIYENRSSAAKGALKLRLRGSYSNRYGLGARITVEGGGAKQVRFLSAARGFLSCDEPCAVFGLGEADAAERLTIEWPSGQIQVFTAVRGGRA